MVVIPGGPRLEEAVVLEVEEQLWEPVYRRQFP